MKPFLWGVFFLKISRIIGLITELDLENKLVTVDAFGNSSLIYQNSVEPTLTEAIRNDWKINALVLEENGTPTIIKAEIEKRTCTVETTNYIFF